MMTFKKILSETILKKRSKPKKLQTSIVIFKMTYMELKIKTSSSQRKSCRYRIKNKKRQTSSLQDNVGVEVNSKTLRSPVRRTKWQKVRQAPKTTQALTSQSKTNSWRNGIAPQTIRYLMTQIISNLSKVKCSPVNRNELHNTVLSPLAWFAIHNDNF